MAKKKSKPIKKIAKPIAQITPTAEIGKTSFDLAWLLYADIKLSHPDYFKEPFNHQWCMSRCMEAVTLQMQERDKIKAIAMTNMDTSPRGRN